jgi:DNA repair protein RecN (Recombination protein N)
VISRIRIQGLGVIDDAELELSPGLNVITGETGAGKTMVVSGLGLLLGARSDAAMVRAGARSAVVEGEIDVPPDHPAAGRVESAGGDAADGIVLVRTVTAQGRSRAHVGGRAAPVGVLAEVGEHLVAVHGQADQWRLRRPDQHRVLLDAFGGTTVHLVRAAYQQTYDEWRTVQDQLDELTTADAERSRRAEMLRSALEEIETTDPQPGEEETLRLEEIRLAHADGLRLAAEQAHQALSGRDDQSVGEFRPVLDLLGSLGPTLTGAGAHDPALAELATRLDEIGYLASDLAGDLASYASGIEVDPQRLAWVQQRRADLGTILRKYGSTTQDVLAWAQESAGVLTDLDGSQERILERTERLTRLHRELGERGHALTAARHEAALALGDQVGEELGHLAMGSATLTVALTHPADDDGVQVPGADHPVQARRHGLDEVEIQLAANPGTAPRSVTRAASGGELSRVMLALEVVSAQGDLPTYVFDEVDAGVAGSAALDLGARLARLAGQAQVIVVTHLGQVAAFADRHLVVSKSTDGQVTSSDVRVVTGPDRVAEIARMLGGASQSTAALQHATELIEEHGPDRVRR